MGCSISATKLYRAPVSPLDLNTSRMQTEIEPTSRQPSDYFPEDLTNLLQGVSKLPKTPNVKTCVVVSDDAFPVFTAPLYFENGDETTITLPIIACSRHFKGRLILICSFDLILKCRPTNTDASVFLENIIRWASCDRRGNLKIDVTGVDNEYMEILKKNTEALGFKIKARDDTASRPHCIITTTRYTDIDDVRNNLDSGVGVILCYYDISDKIVCQDRNGYDELLLEAGIPFSQCNLVVGSSMSDSLKCISPNILLKLNIKHKIKKLKSILSKEKIDIGKFDSVITLLRIHCSVFNDRNSELASEIFEIISSFLFSTKDKGDAGAYTKIESMIAIILMSELFDKIPPQQLAGIDLSDKYPGKTGNVVLSTYKIEIQSLNQWISTGIWLPPGVIAEVNFDRPLGFGCLLQVGSCVHNLVSSTQTNLWKRWPVVALTYEVNGSHAKIASPFGGIVYIIFENPEELFEVTISNVCQYPRLSFTSTSLSNEIWEQTKDIDVPFGEIETTNCVFTLRSEDIREKAVQDFTKRIDDYICMVFSFTALKENKQMRIVIDPGMPLDFESIDSYPLYVNEESLNTLALDKPTKELFILLSNAALFSLPENLFSIDTENILVHLSACAIMKELYPSCVPTDFIEGIPPNNFLEFWETYERCDHLALTEALSRVRNLEKQQTLNENEVWDNFLQEYEALTKADLTPLRNISIISTSSSANVSSIMASRSLHEFIVSENEIEVMK